MDCALAGQTNRKPAAIRMKANAMPPPARGNTLTIPAA
jgi:hypothetical protein